MSNKGRLFIVSAPSGAGKTTLCRNVLKRLSKIVESVSFTTRPSRPKEVEGVDYHFVSLEEFNKMKSNHRFVESAEVHGNWYGTDRKLIEDKVIQGIDVILNVDIVGAANLIKAYPDAVTIFVHTPSFEELKKRLIQRQSDTHQTIEKRLSEAKSEMEASSKYKYQLVNDELEKATSELIGLIKKHRRQQ